MKLKEAKSNLLEAGLNMPSHYSPGDEREYTTHAKVYSVHRDSTMMEESNFEVFKAVLTDFDATQKHWFVSRASHWAVGWTDSIFVEVADDQLIEEMAKLHMQLKDYACLDETGYSELQYNEFVRIFEDEASSNTFTAVDRLIDDLFNDHEIREEDEDLLISMNLVEEFDHYEATLSIDTVNLDCVDMSDPFEFLQDDYIEQVKANAAWLLFLKYDAIGEGNVFLMYDTVRFYKDHIFDKMDDVMASKYGVEK